jgi:hypothetical protein
MVVNFNSYRDLLSPHPQSKRYHSFGVVVNSYSVLSVSLSMKLGADTSQFEKKVFAFYSPSIQKVWYSIAIVFSHDLSRLMPYFSSLSILYTPPISMLYYVNQACR